MSLVTNLAELLLFLKDAFVFVMRAMRDQEIRDHLQKVKEAESDEEVSRALRDLVRTVNK